MDDVVFDDVVEDMLADEPKLAIDCGSGSLEEGPGLGFEFGEIGMRVVEIGNGYDPVIYPHVWL